MYWKRCTAARRSASFAFTGWPVLSSSRLLANTANTNSISEGSSLRVTL